MMSFFDRQLPAKAVERLEDNLRRLPWLADLFGRWRPAGVPLDEGKSKGLRLAVRNGYLNFYRCGQSVAKVSFGADGSPRAETHHKYLDAQATGQRYAKLSHEEWSGLNHSLTYSAVPFAACINRVHEGGHAGAEKMFVEDVLARNADVIDLEMALPAGLRTGPDRVAPRIDLVALEQDEHTHRGVQVVFWEAKGVTDSRMRCRDEKKAPEVVEQLRKYASWIETVEGGERNFNRVAVAYRRVCRLIVDIRAATARAGLSVPELGPLIRMTAESDLRLGVDRAARLLVDARGDDRKLVAHQHLAKLRSQPYGLLVQMVTRAADMHLATYHDLRSAFPGSAPPP